MRISDWSSDVCSSDLRRRHGSGRQSCARGTQHSEYRRAADPGRQRLRYPAPRYAGADAGSHRSAGGTPEMSWKYFRKAAPSQERIYGLILSPVITEKSTLGSEHNQVTFKVPPAANKPEIKGNR